MAAPLVTVPDWVPNVINPQILFITENYPKDPNAATENTYFYRTLRPGGAIGGGNNLLNNICRTLEINGPNEAAKLNTFMNERNYFLIDTFPSGERMNKDLINNTINDIAWLDQIINDIDQIGPTNIVFTCIGSNGKLLPHLLVRAAERQIEIFNNIVPPPFSAGRLVFNSPSDWQFNNFNNQIVEAVRNLALFL